jgi:hypothetical protein
LAKRGRNHQNARTGAPTSAESGKGITLDDFLGIVMDARRTYQLQSPKFSMQDIESYPTARATLQEVIRNTMKFSAGGVYATPSTLLTAEGRIHFEPIADRTGAERRPINLVNGRGQSRSPDERLVARSSPRGPREIPQRPGPSGVPTG